MAHSRDFTPYSSLDAFLTEFANWVPEDEAIRLASYQKYDEFYWNDPRQYKLRVLENEDPIYIPNARRVVDTTAYYLLKGLHVHPRQASTTGATTRVQNPFLDNWLIRESFYGKNHIAKQAGVTRGDWCFHITADPDKPPGERVSIHVIHPGLVIRVPDPDNVDRIVRVHLVDTVRDEAENKTYVKKKTYHKDYVTGRVSFEEALWEQTPKWWGTNEKPKKVKDLIPLTDLPATIDQIPIFWFKNIPWQGQLYGSSELRGFEFLMKAISQAATDTQAALALEGLGVYATDGGRPVGDDGREVDTWEVAPASVMEVPAGSWFRRVEGVGSITPMQDQIHYLEKKVNTAAALSDVALGEIDVQTAESGIALAIKFMPTIAKLEFRDQDGLDTMTQMFFNLRKWWSEYDNEEVPEITPVIGDKLPANRQNTLNELNNMLDRGVISKKYYRLKMEELGYDDFPSDMEKEIAREKEEEAKLKALLAPPALQPNAEAAANGQKPPPPNGGVEARNAARVNESNGTEA